MKRWKLVVLVSALICLLTGMQVMAADADFVIVNGELWEYKGDGGDVVIPDTVTDLGQETFCYCTSLVRVTIPDSVTDLKDGVFGACTSLKSVMIPVSVTEISETAFLGCDNLADIYYGGNEQQWQAIKIKVVWGKDAVPAGVTIHYNSSGLDNMDDGQPSTNTDTINITVSEFKYNSLQIIWEPVAGAKTYEVYYSDSSTGEFRLLKKTSKCEIKFSKANCGQTYYFKVAAYQKSGKTMIPCGSGEASGKTRLTGELNLSAKTNYNSVALKWKKIKGVKEYTVVRSDGVVISGLKSAKYTDKNVEAGKTYTYTVTAVSYGEDRIVSNLTASTNLSKKPKLKVKASSADTLKLSWNKVPGAVFYDVYSIDMVTGETSLIETLHAPQTVYSMTGLKPATPYKYMVVARAGDCEQPSEWVSQTTKVLK